MPWINVIQESEAEGELQEAYARMHEVNAAYGESWGGTQPHPVTRPELASLNPLSMVYGRQFMMHLMRGPSRLTPAQAKGLVLPMDIWGVTEQAKQAKEKASGR